ncbi:MAG: CDP-alcohol phosphatidyltransferase family protein, partial [Nitrospirales bacterium]|nr:CDP-alcohol phosphatidyltransferase family protein [Nitrospirales bacterium]
AFGSGLVAGWIMTFLDTVDGKLARVTVTSSKIGHILDHGLDIIHPPLWYIAWGMGLAAFTPPTPWLSLDTLFGIILAGYIAGRLCEGLFQLCLGQFGLFCWRPIDSFNRLITARRNPNLILLTGSLCIGRPDLGFLAVAAWTVASTIILLIRLGLAFGVRMFSGTPLRPWLADIGIAIDHDSLAAKTFTRPPLTKTIQSTD